MSILFGLVAMSIDVGLFLVGLWLVDAWHNRLATSAAKAAAIATTLTLFAVAGIVTTSLAVWP